MDSDPALRPGVLLDVDGTLIDSNYLHALAWSRAFADAGEWAPMHAIHRLVGMGGDLLVERLLGHPCPEASEARPRHYRALFDDVRVFPDAAELIRHLAGFGLAVVIASSAVRDELDPMLERIGASDVLAGATSADDVDEPKPAPDVFLAAAEAGGVDLRRAIAVGDSVWDVQAARAAGVGCIGVESGGFSAHELREEGALAVYRDVSEVLAQLHTGPIAHLLAT